MDLVPTILGACIFAIIGIVAEAESRLVAQCPGSPRFRLTCQAAGSSVATKVGFPLVFCPWVGVSVHGSAVLEDTRSAGREIK
jgi:hypothetical protein